MTQSLVAIADTPKDDLRKFCLDTLRELGEYKYSWSAV